MGIITDNRVKKEIKDTEAAVADVGDMMKKFDELASPQLKLRGEADKTADNKKTREGPGRTTILFRRIRLNLDILFAVLMVIFSYVSGFVSCFLLTSITRDELWSMLVKALIALLTALVSGVAFVFSLYVGKGKIAEKLMRQGFKPKEEVDDDGRTIKPITK